MLSHKHAFYLRVTAFAGKGFPVSYFVLLLFSFIYVSAEIAVKIENQFQNYLVLFSN